MIILGDISGIQNYLFDIAEAGGGQARRLRARSFFIQILTECAALRVLRKIGWPMDDSHFLLSGAGKFLLRGPTNNGIGNQLEEERQDLNDWLLRGTRGKLRVMLAWVEDAATEVKSYRRAQRTLQMVKSRPWGSTRGPSVASAVGGDDLVMIGPWDVMVDFAGHIHEHRKRRGSWGSSNSRRLCNRGAGCLPRIKESGRR